MEKKDTNCQGCGASLNPTKIKCDYCGRFHNENFAVKQTSTSLSHANKLLIAGVVAAPLMFGIMSALSKYKQHKKKKRFSFLNFT